MKSVNEIDLYDITNGEKIGVMQFTGEKGSNIVIIAINGIEYFTLRDDLHKAVRNASLATYEH